jgi:hypothetical protein
MLSRVRGWFSSSSDYGNIPRSQQSLSSVGGLFKSTNEDALLAKARASGNGDDAFELAEFYFRKEDDSSYVKGTAWLVAAIRMNCTEAVTLFQKDKLLFPSESSPSCTRRKSNVLSRCTFIALMLLDRPLLNLETSGWIASWKEENRPRFMKFNNVNSREKLLDAINKSDRDALFLLSAEYAEQKKIFNDFFAYCFDNSLLGVQHADRLGVSYSPSYGEKHGESTSLLGGNKSHRRYV